MPTVAVGELLGVAREDRPTRIRTASGDGRNARREGASPEAKRIVSATDLERVGNHMVSGLRLPPSLYSSAGKMAP